MEAILKKKSIVEIAIIRLMSIAIQLIFLKIYASHTSVFQLGVFYFLFTVSYALNAFLLIPLDYFQQSKLYALKSTGISLRSFGGLNKKLLMTALGMLIVGELICLVFAPQYCFTLLVIILLALTTYGVTFLRNIVNNLERRRLAIYSLLLEGTLKICFYLFLLCFFPASAILILITLLGSSIVSLGVLLWAIQRMPEFRKTEELQHFSIGEIVKFSFPITIGAAINWIQIQGYRMLLVPLGMVEMVGIYGTVSNVGASGMNAFASVFNQLFVPNLYKSGGKYIWIYVRHASICILFIIGVGYALSGTIVKLLTTSELAAYAGLIVFGIVAEACNFLIGAFTIYLTLHNLTKATLMASLSGLVVFVLVFSVLYVNHILSVFTVGIPIVVSQLIMTLYYAIIVNKQNE